MEEKIVTILNEMSEYLSIAQMKKLQEVMLDAFSGKIEKRKQISNQLVFSQMVFQIHIS